MSPKLSAIVLNYAHLSDTINCLKALRRSKEGKQVQYIVVDNSPQKGTGETLSKIFPDLIYLSSPANLGFAGGNNLGIKKALSSGSTHILIINPDVTIGTNFFEPLLKHFSDQKVGLVAPAIKHVQKGQIFYGLEGKVNWKLAKPEHCNLRHLNDLRPIVSEFVSFACVIISKETFEKVGLLDDKYFMYFEDVDYCLTARKHGQKIILDPGVLVSHQTSSSFKKPTQKLLISFKSHLRFIYKWLPVSKRLVPLFYCLFLYPYLYVLWSYHGLKYK